MKNILILFGAIILSCTACEEKIEPKMLFMPTEEEEVIDTIVQEDKKVLIEEFTGVRCVNCPAGSAAIENLLAIHGERLVAISIHAGSFAVPYTGQEDYKTQAGQNILDLLGGEFAFPIAAVNRKIFPGQSNPQAGSNSWPGHIDEELEIPSPLVVDIANSYDDNNRALQVTVSIGADETVSEPLYLSVLITENNIIGPQYTPDNNPQTDYKHKHVFRAILSNTTGDLLSENGLLENETFEKNYSFTLPEHWVVENCKVIALVHLGGEKTDVLQVDELGILE